MPYRPPRMCPKCRRAVPGGKPCPHCAPANRRTHEARRPSARQRGYTSEWDKAAKAFLRAHPWCAICGARATVVDHIAPHRGDRRLFWDSDNWQPLCASCHSGHKQAREKRQ